MKLLLDTHCLLWLIDDAPKLTVAMRRRIDDAEAVYFSPVSIWEIGLKWRAGKLTALPRDVQREAVNNGLVELPIENEAIFQSCELQQKHPDPFDRLLYAQAKHHKLKLLTADRALIAFGTSVIAKL